ncbi:MAG: T9SS type A sorting domain-containing protein [candidate division WOR-3 bacterium]
MRKLIIFLLLISFTLFGRKYYVPEIYPTIQEATISACEEDTVSIVFGSRNLNKEKIYVKEKVFGKSLIFELRSGSKNDLFRMLNVDNFQSSFSTDRNVPPYGWQGMRKILLSPTGNFKYYFSCIDFDENDIPYLVYAEGHYSPPPVKGYWGIMCKKWENNNWGCSTVVSPVDDTWEVRVNLKVINNRNIWVVWCASFPHGISNDRILYSHYDGNRWGEPRQLSPETSLMCWEFMPFIDYGDKNLWVVWISGDPSVVDYTVYGSRWNWEGKYWEEPVMISPRGRAGYSCHWFPNIAVDKKGRPHVIWSEPYSGAIYYRTTDMEGRWLEPRIINNPQVIRCAGWGCTSIDVDDEGRIYVAWLGYSGGYDLYYQFSLNGDEFTPPMKVEENNIDDYPLNKIFGNGPQEVWVVWEKGGCHVYASYFNGVEWEKSTLIDDGEIWYYSSYQPGINSYFEPWVPIDGFHSTGPITTEEGLFWNFYIKKGVIRKRSRIVDNKSSIRRVPERYPSIQEAIDAADEGDTISVWKWPWEPVPKIYYETLNFKGKHIFVVNRSFLPRETPGYDSSWDHIIIDGMQMGPVSTYQVSNLNKITSPVLNISPNIIKDKLNIKYFLPKEEEVSLILYDNNGRKVKLIDKGKKDKNEITLLTKDLNNGLYFLILRGKDFNLKRKLIILK